MSSSFYLAVWFLFNRGCVLLHSEFQSLEWRCFWVWESVSSCSELHWLHVCKLSGLILRRVLSFAFHGCDAFPQAGARCPPLLCGRAGSHLVKPIILIFLYFPIYSVLWCFPPPGSSYGTQTKLSLSWSALYLPGPSSPYCSFGSSSYLPSAVVSIFLCSSTTTRILYSLCPSTHSTSKRYPLPAFSFSPPGPRASRHSLGRDDRICFSIFYQALSFQDLKRV